MGDMRGDARPEGPRAGVEFLGRGQLAPSQPALGLGSAVSSRSGVRGGAPAAEGFPCILYRQIAFPSIIIIIIETFVTRLLQLKNEHNRYICYIKIDKNR